MIDLDEDWTRVVIRLLREREWFANESVAARLEAAKKTTEAVELRAQLEASIAVVANTIGERDSALQRLEWVSRDRDQALEELRILKARVTGKRRHKGLRKP